MRIESEIENGIENEVRIAVIGKMVRAHMQQHEYRCYLKPAKINGHPIGYCGAMTFKIINVKRRSDGK